jgi:hypothetical protein
MEDIIGELINKYRSDKESLDVVKLRIILDYLLDISDSTKELLGTVLVIPKRDSNGEDIDGYYRPIKNTTKNDCYKVIWDLKHLIGGIR